MIHSALRHLRLFNRISQQEMAKRLGISNTYLSEIESGAKAHAITVDLLSKYSGIFDVPVSSLLLFSEQMDSRSRSDRVRILLTSKLINILDWIEENGRKSS